MRDMQPSRSGSTARFVVAAFLSLAALGAPGCGRRPAREPSSVAPGDSSRTVVPGDNPAAIPHPSPPQPSGPQIGRGDPLINAFRPDLAEWAGLWAAALPGFALDSLWRVRSGKWAPLMVQPFASPPTGPDSEPAAGLAFAILGLHSPDGRFILDIDSYQAIEPDGNGLQVGGEPDSKCTLIDAGKHLGLTLMQTGTGGGYQWGTWLSPTSFALGGWNSADDYSRWQQGRLWLYSISDSTVTEYETRIVPNATYTRYEAAWHGWLLQRYRALGRPRHPA